MPARYPEYRTCHHRFKNWYASGVLRVVSWELFGIEALSYLMTSPCACGRREPLLRPGCRFGRSDTASPVRQIQTAFVHEPDFHRPLVQHFLVVESCSPHSCLSVKSAAAMSITAPAFSLVGSIRPRATPIHEQRA
ncbi:hypothetical protein G3A43_39705 [Paraburkholderia aspalathi]|uniref:hypothetical protein n=1 Tax=Paraburkholderia nemoris TaxID=2793076 RepID=UPI001909D555|nr:MULTISPECIES: hypothetical protein [Paraburkholderia]MBK3786332.1 hypothetical protein [Paraburkholderia aspalathi]